MNILVDSLPDALTITTTEYAIDSDFRACLQIILAFEDNELTPQEKQIVLLSRLFVRLPRDTREAINQAIWFLNGGHVSENESDGLRLYSFAKDADFIFAAFRQTHNIDLRTANLHWWEFIALFMDLGSETTFCQLTAMRKRLKTGKASKEEKEFAREHPEIIDLPEIDNRTLEEKVLQQEFLQKVMQAEARRKHG